MNAHLRADTDEQRTQIERSTALIRRDVLLVEAHHLACHLHKSFGGHLRHQRGICRPLQARSILLNAEKAHLSVGTTIGFQTLESLLSVVKCRCRHVQFNIFVGANLNLSPFSVAIIAPHVVARWPIAKP